MPRPPIKSRLSAEQEIRNRMKAAEMEFRGARAQVDSLNQAAIKQDLMGRLRGSVSPKVVKPRPRRKPSNRNLS